MKKYWIKFCAFFALSAAVCAFAVFISNMWDTPAVPAVAQTTEDVYKRQGESGFPSSERSPSPSKATVMSSADRPAGRNR